MNPRRDPWSDRRLFGDLLLEAGLVSRSGLEAGLAEQRLRGGRLGYNLLRTGGVTPAAFYLFLQDHLPTLSADLVETMQGAPAADRLPARLVHHYQVAPVRVEAGVLHLAVANADLPGLFPALAELTGLRIDPLVCPPALIADCLARSWPAEVEPGVVHRAAGDSILVVSDRSRGLGAHRLETLPEDAPGSEWLRAIAAEAIRRGARRLRIDPEPAEMNVAFQEPLGEESRTGLPPGAYPAVSSLLLGLSGIAARGRVAPREGRLALGFEGRWIAASVLALPGIRGDTLLVDLREPRIADAGRDDLTADLPDLPGVLDGFALARRGLLLIAGPGPAEWSAGLAAVLQFLGDRMPVRVAVGNGWGHPTVNPLPRPVDEEEIPLEHVLARASAERPDLVILPAADRREDLAAAMALARNAPVIAPMTASDAFAVDEEVARRGFGVPEAGETLIGIVGARLMEQLCAGCRRPYDLIDLLSPWPPHRRPAPGAYYAAQGCRGCRGSGALRLEPVLEFVPGPLLLPGRRAARAGDARRERVRQGKPTLFQAGLRRAAAGRVDVREPLRLLLHEQH